MWHLIHVFSVCSFRTTRGRNECQTSPSVCLFTHIGSHSRWDSWCQVPPRSTDSSSAPYSLSSRTLSWNLNSQPLFIVNSSFSHGSPVTFVFLIRYFGNSSLVSPTTQISWCYSRYTYLIYVLSFPLQMFRKCQDCLFYFVLQKFESPSNKLMGVGILE